MIRFLALAIALGLAACSARVETPASVYGGEIADVVSVEGAFIRRPLGGQTHTLAGFNITASQEDLQLIGASSSIASLIEVHISEDQNGMATMRRVEAIPLPTDSVITFGQGGPHLMLFGWNSDAATQTGDTTAPLTLVFKDSTGTEFTLNATAQLKNLGE